MKLSELALLVSGRIYGDPDTEVTGISGIHEAEEGEATFLSNRRLINECAKSKASCVFVKDYIKEIDKPQVIVNNPHYAFARLLEHFYIRPPDYTGISPMSYVSGKAKISADVSVGPFSHISDNAEIGTGTFIHPGVFVGEGSTIGPGCLIYPNVVIREGVAIGSRVIIHPGVVIGADGFGYVFEHGQHNKIPHIGGVIIGDDVEIGANVTIDRATTGNTIIGSCTKIDNLVQIGHNVKIGANCIIVAQVGVGGSAEIGNYVVIGGQAAVSDHAKIDDGCMIGARSGVLGHLTKGIYSGAPVIPHRDWLKATTVFAKLPELARRLKDLEDKLNKSEGGDKDVRN